jgi:NAD(P)-dependent dehydrogenase (short-subunit alcohol dehydrogenase family)
MAPPAPEPALAIVTGASRGIGQGIALRLAADGFHVLLTARDVGRLAQVQAEIVAAGGGATVLALDLAQAGSVGRIVAAAQGLPPLGVLVNNAGTAPSDKLEHTADAVLAEVLELHVRAPFRLVRELLPAFRARGSGCIVQLASTAGVRGYPYTAAYSAAKGGMVGFTRALAAELAALRLPEVRAYAVCPGFVDTEITRAAARAVAARGRSDEQQALARFAAHNRIGRLHAAAEVAGAVARLVRERPAGCVLDLDRDPPMMLPEP